VGLHVGLLFFLSIRLEGPAAAPKDVWKGFSLVNIAVLEEGGPVSPDPAAEPEPAAVVAEPEPAAKPAQALRPAAPKGPPPEVPALPDTRAAERYLEGEERGEDREAAEAGGTAEAAALDASGTAETVAVPAAAPAGGTATGVAPARTGDYVRLNYDYIQRRIRDRLVYPSVARRAGMQGVAELVFTIHEDGRVSDVRVRKSSGHSLLDEAAVKTVFAAAPFPRPPAPARLAIPIAFRLR
jgi:protein TonB